MAIARTTLAALIAAFGLAATSPAAHAAGPHVDRLALQLQGQARQLGIEFRLHFRHTAAYGHLVSDTSRIYAKSIRIHQLTHFTNHTLLLQRDLAELDRLFHHLEGLVHDVQIHASHGHGGHVHGHLGHVNELLLQMEDTLHHLRQDVAAIGHGPVPIPAPGIGWNPVPPPPHGGHGHGGIHPGHGPAVGHRGITLGNRNFRFRIGF